MSAVPKSSAALQWPDQATSPGWELVLYCVRSHRDAAQSNRIRAILGRELDWSQVARTIIQHRVAPSFYAGLIAEAPETAPASEKEKFREMAQASARTSLLLLQQLVRIYNLFEAANIPVIPYKGAILAGLAYGNFAGREFSDLDLVTRQQYIPRATAILLEAGFIAEFDAKEAHAGEEDFAPGQYSFSAPSHEFQIELHSERTLRYFPSPIDFLALESRLIDVEIGGRTLRTFSIEDTLVMLSVHGAKHFWERLGWILDISELLRAQSVNWDRALKIAAQMESTRLLLLAVFLAHRILGASLPPSILRRAETDRSVQWLANRVCLQYGDASATMFGVLPRTIFRLRSRDAIGQGLRHLLLLAVRPTESDRRMARLPRFLSPLYMIMRPWRLLRDYGLRSKLKSGRR